MANRDTLLMQPQLISIRPTLCSALQQLIHCIKHSLLYNARQIIDCMKYSTQSLQHLATHYTAYIQNHLISIILKKKIIFHLLNLCVWICFVFVLKIFFILWTVFDLLCCFVLCLFWEISLVCVFSSFSIFAAKWPCHCWLMHCQICAAEDAAENAIAHNARMHPSVLWAAEMHYRNCGLQDALVISPLQDASGPFRSAGPRRGWVDAWGETLMLKTFFFSATKILFSFSPYALLQCKVLVIKGENIPKINRHFLLLNRIDAKMHRCNVYDGIRKQSNIGSRLWWNGSGLFFERRFFVP